MCVCVCVFMSGDCVYLSVCMPLVGRWRVREREGITVIVTENEIGWLSSSLCWGWLCSLCTNTTVRGWHPFSLVIYPIARYSAKDHLAFGMVDREKGRRLGYWTNHSHKKPCNIYIYIYIYRERERERSIYNTHVLKWFAS